MKKHLFILVAVLFGNYAFAGNATKTTASNSTVEPSTTSTKLISGKVIDKISGEEIAGAEIQIGEKKVYSDLNGNFSAVVSTDTRISKVEAAVNYISYNEACITIDLFSFNPLVIEILSK